VIVPAGQAREEVLELRELHLGPRLARPRVGCEDVQDDPGAIDGAETLAPALLEVARLAGSQLVIEHDERRALLAGALPDFLDRPLPDVRLGIGSGALLDETRDDLGARRVHEPFELVQVLFGHHTLDKPRSHAHEHRSLSTRVHRIIKPPNDSRVCQ
jgi:hypothetical protein